MATQIEIPVCRTYYLLYNNQRPLTSCRRSYVVARLFDFELSFLGRKHFAENIIDGVGVSALFNQFVFFFRFIRKATISFLSFVLKYIWYFSVFILSTSLFYLI